MTQTFFHFSYTDQLEFPKNFWGPTVKSVGFKNDHNPKNPISLPKIVQKLAVRWSVEKNLFDIWVRYNKGIQEQQSKSKSDVTSRFWLGGEGKNGQKSEKHAVFRPKKAEN